MKRVHPSTRQALKGLALGTLTVVVVAASSPDAFAQATYTLNVNVSTPEGHPYNVGVAEFKRAVEEGSDGDIAVQVFPSAQLGGEVESARNVQLGTLEATILSTSNLASFHGPYEIFSVPYILQSVSCSFAVLESELGEEMAENLRESSQLRILGYYTFGSRHLFNSVRPVETVDDLKGLKIRAPDAFLEATWRALGASPVPLPFPEVFPALQQGVIDGDANPLTSMRTFRWYEAAKHVAFTNTAIGIGVLVMSENLFQSMPQEHQTLLLEAGKAGSDLNREVEATLAAEAEDYLREQGVQFTTPDLEGFEAQLTPVFDMATERYGEERLERIREIQSGC